MEKANMSHINMLDTEILELLGEHFAAGFYSEPEAPMVERFARALRQWAVHVRIPAYDGGLLYPHGPSIWASAEPMAVSWYYVAAFPLNRDTLSRKMAAADDRGRDTLTELERAWSAYKFAGGYTHSIPNYGRVLTEGLDGYAVRVSHGLEDAVGRGDPEREAFYTAMEITLDTASILHRRFVEELKRASFSDDTSERNRQRLIDAFSNVPFAPANGFFEALVATNFIFYLDGCDNLGRFDQYLWPYYKSSRGRGLLEREQAVELVRAMWRNVDAASGWNVAIGGTDSKGHDVSNELTVVSIEAARGMRRPNLALRLSKSTPDEVWDAALNTIASGGGLPALYWAPNYYNAMRASEIPLPEEEMHEFAFGGCTELMVQGKSNVGSLDDCLNVPEVLCRATGEHLGAARSFDEFYAAFRRELTDTIDQMCDRVNSWQEIRSLYHPQPIRSLLVDDCIDTGREFSAGGARYNWSVINVMGLANAIDSLAALREVVFEQGEVSAEEMVRALDENFRGHELLRKRLERAPRFGNGNSSADDIARTLSEFIFHELLRHRAWRGGPFVPSCLMFVTYVEYGLPVGATPDGRLAGAPIADSAGPYQGRDTSGPTAMLRSVATIDQKHAPGTLVVNIRVSKKYFETETSRAKLKGLICGYFRMGGLQLQVNVIDQQTLREAVAHPESYGDLVVRVGGYSEYWRNLTPELRRTILERIEH